MTLQLGIKRTADKMQRMRVTATGNVPTFSLINYSKISTTYNCNSFYFLQSSNIW